MSFLESYKKLDALCKDICRQEKGVTAYLEEMDRHSSAKNMIPGWASDYKKLKHYRHIRNQIVHEVGTDENACCTKEDVKWIEDFYKRIMKQTDPLAMYRQKQGKKQTDPSQEDSLLSTAVCVLVALFMAGVILYMILTSLS